MIPEIIKPYIDHPLVQNKSESELEILDEKHLNDIIRAEDQIIRGIREYYLENESTRRLHPGHFGSSVMIARGLAFLDIAHHKRNVLDICNDVWKITPTTATRVSFNKNIDTSIIPRLKDGRFIEFDSQLQSVENCIPYPVGSKLFVQKNLIENPRLYSEQINHFDIIRSVQDFPELTSEIESNVSNPQNYFRDFSALNEVDVIRTQNIRNRDFTFSRGFFTGEQSSEAWLKVLDSADEVRMGLKSLMDLQGDYGGFISHHELVQATGWNSRAINRLIRSIDHLGIAQRTHTLEMEDALSRATSGTTLNMNYHELNNAQSILVLTRSVPESIEMLYRLQSKNEISEEDLMDEFGIVPVQRVRNSLKTIGVITEDALHDGVLKLAPFRGYERFLSDVLAVCAHSRHVLEPDYNPDKQLEEQFRGIDEQNLEKEAQQMKLDFYGIVNDEYIK